MYHELHLVCDLCGKGGGAGRTGDTGTTLRRQTGQGHFGLGLKTVQFFSHELCCATYLEFWPLSWGFSPDDSRILASAGLADLRDARISNYPFRGIAS